MDIIFIIPPVQDENTDFDNVLSRSVEMVPLGVFYMATVLSNSGYNVEVADFAAVYSDLERESRLNTMLSHNPKIVGISTSTASYPAGKKIARFLRRKFDENIIIVWGGYHVTFLPEEPLNEGLADIVVRGEGEYAMRGIAKYYLENIGELSSINGISYTSNGCIIHNPPAVLRIQKIDDLPIPARNFVELKKYTNPGTLISTRGCNSNCQFCPAGSFGAITKRSSVNVIKEIKQLYYQYQIKHLSFIDNTFTTHKERTLQIFDGLNREKEQLSFALESRVSQVNEEYIKRLAESNVVLIQFGIETGNEIILKKIRKAITLQQAESVVNLCLKNNINVKTSFIIGHPYDTEETVLDTIKFAKKMVKLGARAYFSILTPFPGTYVFNQRENLGINIFNWDFSKWNCLQPVMNTKYLSAVEIKKYFKIANAEIFSI